MKYAYFKGKIVPFNEAKISVMTHAFNYGTAVFEGIRSYWNAEHKKMYILKLKEHFKRLKFSADALSIELKLSVDELCRTTVELVRKNDYQEDLYIRPIAYKSQEKIGLGLRGVEDDYTCFVAPFGNYLDISKGIKVCISPWRRIPYTSMPKGTKICGLYFNSSLAKSDALAKGFDEAIMLSSEGLVGEGSGENLFLIKDGKVSTPALSENILEGITRDTLIGLFKDELGITVSESKIPKEELYRADELFFCGTGAQVSPITSVENKPIGNGRVGELTKKIQQIYFDAVKGKNPKYRDWLIPV